jgi:hypothetical protein
LQVLEQRVRGPRVDHELRCHLVREVVWDWPHEIRVNGDILLERSVPGLSPLRCERYHSLPFVQVLHSLPNLPQSITLTLSTKSYVHGARQHDSIRRNALTAQNLMSMVQGNMTQFEEMP